jgi:hypothetical protein
MNSGGNMRMMHGSEHDRWRERNLRENSGYTLKPGDKLKNRWWESSTVAEINNPVDSTIENHGSITVVMSDGRQEHYAYHGWQSNFRVERTDMEHSRE